MSATLLTILLVDTLRCNVMVVLQTELIVKALSFGFTVRYGDTRNAIRTAKAMPPAKGELFASARYALPRWRTRIRGAFSAASIVRPRTRRSEFVRSGLT